MSSSASFTEALSKSTTVLQNSFTNLASNDRWKHDELDDLVEQLVQETDTGIQQGPFQRHHAGLQLCLHVWLSNDHVLQAEGEGILLQHVHQGEELIQEGVLQSHTSIKMRSNGQNPLVRWEKGRQTLEYLRTWVWTEEAAATSTLNTPLWLSTHFMPGSWTYITVKFIPFNTQSKHQGSFSGKPISSQWLSSCLHQGWARSSWEGAFQPRQANWSSLFWVGRAASGGSTTSGKKGRGAFKDGRTTEETLKRGGVWVGVWKSRLRRGENWRCSQQESPEECFVWVGSWCGRRWTWGGDCQSDWQESSSSSLRKTRGTFWKRKLNTEFRKTQRLTGGWAFQVLLVVIDDGTVSLICELSTTRFPKDDLVKITWINKTVGWS